MHFAICTISSLLLILSGGAQTATASLFGGKKTTEPVVENVVTPGWEHVTSGSTIKLGHGKSTTRLTLPQVSYGTGSQQQAITAFTDTMTTRALWLVEQPDTLRGTPIACGSEVRLVNSDSGHSLHSHAAHKAPISGAQEVSGFDGRDSGDMWVVECTTDMWMRESPVYLKHVETGQYLQSLPNKKYRQPIVGHQEVSGGKKPDANSQWIAMEGYYFVRKTTASAK
ncbi:hypothetical protein LPJ73_008967 [Coemansia sp. RSA 2703]|nr:hypothetical protein LPJ73_008967 [Coemansia sp. RSA 2703]